MKKYIIPLFLLASPAYAALDYQCLSDCMARYSYTYCKQACTVHEQPPQARPQGPFDAYIQGRAAKQAEEARELELEKLWADVARREAADRQQREEELKKQEEADLRAKLEAENEALRKELERQKKEKNSE